MTGVAHYEEEYRRNVKWAQCVTDLYGHCNMCDSFVGGTHSATPKDSCDTHETPHRCSLIEHTQRLIASFIEWILSNMLSINRVHPHTYLRRLTYHTYLRRLNTLLHVLTHALLDFTPYIPSINALHPHTYLRKLTYDRAY